MTRERGNESDGTDATLNGPLAGLTSAVNDLGTRAALVSGRRTLGRSDLENTTRMPLWRAIIEHTEAIGFERYQRFVDDVLECYKPRSSPAAPGCEGVQQRFDTYILNRGLDPYQLVKIATEAFLLREAGVCAYLDDRATGPTHLGKLLAEHALKPGGIPGPGTDYPDRLARGVETPVDRGEARDRLRSLFGSERVSYLDAILPTFETDAEHDWSPFAAWRADLQVCPPLIELLWSYWHEEGMLSQTLNAIALRFQNVRRSGAADRLSELAFDALRPLSSFLFSYVNDETNRLSVLRRAYEYNQQYGLALVGRATRGLRPADGRSQFVEAFHNLLRLTAIFHSQDDDTTVVADGFPVLNALKEVHLILAEGAHNQFRDLPWAARVEMMVEQWLMARPEMTNFLRGRYMVPYVEKWMGGVDAMKRLQGWSDVSVTHFRDLAVYGERLLLTIRHYRWIETSDHEEARTWARIFRPELQGYIHAYRAATGVDLSNPDVVDATIPAVHLQRRLMEQRRAQTRPYARQQFVRAQRPGTVVELDASAIIASPAPGMTAPPAMRALAPGRDGDGRAP